MNDFRKWMDITSKLYEEQDDEYEDMEDEEQLDEVAPLVIAAARGLAAGAGSAIANKLMGSDQIDELKDVPDETDEWEEEDELSADSGLEDQHMVSPEYRDTDAPAVDLPDQQMSSASEDVSELISDIDFYQTNGTSMSDKTYDVEKLLNAPADTIKRIHRLVTGN